MKTEEIDLCETILNGILEIFGVKKENLGEGVYEEVVKVLKEDLLTRKPEVVAKKTLKLLREKDILTQEQTEEALKTLEEEVEKQVKVKEDSGEKMAEAVQRMATSPKLMTVMQKLEPRAGNPRLVNQWFEEFEDRWTLSYTAEERNQQENAELKLVHLRILYGMKVRTFMDGKANELKDTYDKAKNLILKRFGSDSREDDIDKLVNFKIRTEDPEQFNEDAQRYRDLIEKAYGDVREKELLNRLGSMLRGDLQTMFFTYMASIEDYDDMVAKLIQYMNIKGSMREKKFKSNDKEMLQKNGSFKENETSLEKKKCYSCGELGHLKALCPQRKMKEEVKTTESASKITEDAKDRRIEELTAMVNRLSKMVNEEENTTRVCRRVDVTVEKKNKDEKKKFKEFYVMGSIWHKNKKNDDITEVPVICLVDTGSTRTIITESVYRVATKKNSCNLKPVIFTT
uniref:CCHC-type domain-containing protein n=1 Tax=Strongyloides papillosus TaxID=174720 RepID=A0A0N5BLT4_STREA